MTDYTNKDELEAWLKTMPREVSVVLASRCAMRVVPVLAEWFVKANLIAQPSLNYKKKDCLDWLMQAFRSALTIDTAVLYPFFVKMAVACRDAADIHTIASHAEDADFAAKASDAVADAIAYGYVDLVIPDYKSFS